MNVGLAAAIAIGSTLITGYIQKKREMHQAAIESAQAFTESSQSISDYAAKYKELHEALIAAQGNEQETYNVKQQLLSL